MAPSKWTLALLSRDCWQAWREHGEDPATAMLELPCLEILKHGKLGLSGPGACVCGCQYMLWDRQGCRMGSVFPINILHACPLDGSAQFPSYLRKTKEGTGCSAGQSLGEILVCCCKCRNVGRFMLPYLPVQSRGTVPVEDLCLGTCGRQRAGAGSCARALWSKGDPHSALLGKKCRGSQLLARSPQLCNPSAAHATCQLQPCTCIGAEGGLKARPQTAASPLPSAAWWGQVHGKSPVSAKRKGSMACWVFSLSLG